MRILIFTALIVIICPAMAQNKDALLWTGLEVDLPVTKDFGLKMETQTRLKSNFTQLATLYGELGAGYEPINDLRFSLTYRYSRKDKGDYFGNENRFCTNVRYKIDVVKGLDLRFRARYQVAFNRLTVVNDIAPETKNVFRFAGSLKYKNKEFKRIIPFVSAELFFPLDPVLNGDKLDTWRARIGIDLDLPKRITGTIFYMYEHENRSYDNINHIYCITLGYEFKRLNKKKKKKKDEKPRLNEPEK